MILHKYKIYCETDVKFEYTDFRDSSLAPPTTCPVDTSHVCKADSVAIHETIDTSIQQVDTKQQIDTESAPLTRLKYAPKGWTYQAHFIEIKTSSMGGVYSSTKEGTAVGFSSLKFYQADGTEIISGLQTDIDTLCVHTRIIWEPIYSIEVISGSITNLNETTQDVRMWATAAPHIPAEHGGTKAFIQGGLNLKFLPAKIALRTDGRASKFIALDIVNYSHRWHFDFKHPAGLKHDILLLLEFYKA